MSRDSRDYYPTPRAAFAPLLSILPPSPWAGKWEGEYWDPCCGDGRLVTWLRESGRQAGGADIHPSDLELNMQDFLTDATERDFIITNPPFSLAFEFCQHALDVAPEAMLLLRLNFLASDTRAAWFKDNEPNALFVLQRRPSFVMSCTCKTTPVGGTKCGHKWALPIESARPKLCRSCLGSDISISTSDNSDYAWFYWGRRYQGIKHI